MTTPAAAPSPSSGRRPGQPAGTPVLVEYTGTPRPGWRHLSACDDASADVFFPEPGDPRYDDLVREAKGICASCLVRADCLAWAFGHDERFGVWGGLDEYERGRVRQRRSKP